MKKLLKKWLVYALMTVIALPAWLGLGYVTAPRAMAAGSVPSVAIGIDNTIINPSAGTPIVASIDLNFSEQVTADLNILNSSQTKVRDIAHWTLSNAVKNPAAKTWDGTDGGESGGGALLPDGVYTVQVIFTDTDGDDNTVIDTTKTITIDTTAPIITVNQYTVTSTNQSITVLADTNEGTLNASSHIFTVNGSFDFVATDTIGNIATKTITITNIDKTLPVITMTGTSVSIDQFSYYQDAGATAVDGATNLTSSIVSTSDVDTTVAEVYTVKYNVSDAAGNPATEVTRNVTVVGATSVSLNETHQAVILAGAGSLVTVPADVADASLDLAALLNLPGVDSQSVTISDQITVNSTLSDNSLFGLIFSGTPLTITGPLGWDGTFNLPTIVDPASVAPTATAGTTISDVVSIGIGSSDSSLTLDQPAKLILVGKGDKKVGFIKDGVFTEITTICDDVDAPGNFVDPLIKECKGVSADGKDLIVWTKHFTEYVTYTATTVVAPAFTIANFSITKTVVNGANTVSVTWDTVTGADGYTVSLNGVTKPDLGPSVTTANYTVDSGTFTVLVRAFTKDGLGNKVYSTNTATKSVEFVVTVVPEPTPADVAVVRAASFAPAKATAAVTPAPPAVTATPEKTADTKGVIKGQETTTDEGDNINWTPWIVLMILILLAGAATGGYFYWFAGQKEGKPEPKKIVEKTILPVEKSAKAVKKPLKKKKRW